MPTVDKARKELEFLTHFLELVESYNPDTLEKKIILEYAHFDSGKKVFELLNKIGLVDEYEFVMNVIKSKPMDELHKIVRSDYMLRTRAARNPKHW